MRKRFGAIVLAIAGAACGGEGAGDAASGGDAAVAPDGGPPRDAGTVAPIEVPEVPVGLAAYREWERWPAIRIGNRTIMRSTYDRAGGNESVDASHFLRSEAEDRWSASEIAHDWDAPDASPPTMLTSQWDADRLAGEESTDDFRITPGTTEFSLTLDPDNAGVLLRRKLDYGEADQRAEVFVADESDGTVGPFARVGEWYLAGSTRCVFSNPRGELDPPLPILQDSGRRWREDELLIHPRHTRGRVRIRVLIVDRTVPIPLLPDTAPPPGRFTAARYRAYVWRLPLAP